MAWFFFSDGFVSIVADKDNGDRLLVRTDRHLYSIRNPSRQP